MSKSNQAGKSVSVPPEADSHNPEDYDNYANMEQGENPSSENQKQTFAHSSYEASAIIKGFRLLPNRKTIVADITVLAGSTLDDNGKEITRFLNGSYFVSKSIKNLATSLLNAKFGDEGNGVRCHVKIGNFHCDPTLGDDGRIFANYTGFLNELKFGN